MKCVDIVGCSFLECAVALVQLHLNFQTLDVAPTAANAHTTETPFSLLLFTTETLVGSYTRRTPPTDQKYIHASSVIARGSLPAERSSARAVRVDFVGVAQGAVTKKTTAVFKAGPGCREAHTNKRLVREPSSACTRTCHKLRALGPLAPGPHRLHDADTSQHVPSQLSTADDAPMDTWQFSSKAAMCRDTHATAKWRFSANIRLPVCTLTRHCCSGVQASKQHNSATTLPTTQYTILPALCACTDQPNDPSAHKQDKEPHSCRIGFDGILTEPQHTLLQHVELAV